jgi:hypothetical protein
MLQQDTMDMIKGDWDIQGKQVHERALVNEEARCRLGLMPTAKHRRCVGIVARQPNDLPQLNKETMINNFRQPTYSLCNVGRSGLTENYE